ncbi:Metallo-dependent phosphatase [Rickenella mellea]|uniref:Metallo-dependent phosphatase n=1 Tax=Rickenella mellea TaxID=50990 RepID=A0A4Y7PGE8_9AGAM|nr:Metallo-dependent phosphatase [Rickenella mellea]
MKTRAHALGRGRRLLAFLAPSLLIAVTRFVWVALVLWFEIGVFFFSVARCRWPDDGLRRKAVDAGVDRSTSTTPIKHFLLIADPQVLDHRSYPGRGGWLMRLTQFVVDLNLRKNWMVATRFRPDVVVFLGDMMDNGRVTMGDDEYQRYFNRFNAMFKIPPSTEELYIPGNHDVGLGSSRSFSNQRRQRYTRHFGPLNHLSSHANHTLLFLDAPGLVDEDYQRAKKGADYRSWNALGGGAVEFVRRFAADGPGDEPAILFSHIPLFRPDSASCGPLRERGTIRRGVGHGYQNTLGKQTTQFLLQSVQPSLIFSGDDHDYCEYTHSIPIVEEGPAPRIHYAREVTVKSFSMAMGIKRPGFQLLSLTAPSPLIKDAPSHADTPCHLPDQLGIYTSGYALLAGITLLVIFGVNVRRSVRTRRPAPFSSYTHDTHTSPLPRYAPLPLVDVDGYEYGDGEGGEGDSPPSPSGLRPDSAIWAPFSPMSGSRVSPEPEALPAARSYRGGARVNGHGRGGHSGIGNGNGDGGNGTHTPTYRVSRPPTPLDSSLMPSAGLGSFHNHSHTHSHSHGHKQQHRYAGDGVDDDDDDLMSPAQFVFTPSHSRNQSLRFGRGGGAGAGGDRGTAGAGVVGGRGGEGEGEIDETSGGGSYFLPVPGGRHQHQHAKEEWRSSSSGRLLSGRGNWTWTWTFVLRGRRRRITIRPPTWIWIPNSIHGLSRFLRRNARMAMTSSAGRGGGIMQHSRRERGLVRMFAEDVWATAWPPVLLFGVISWWMFR